MTNLCWEQEVLGPLESGGGGFVEPASPSSSVFLGGSFRAELGTFDFLPRTAHPRASVGSTDFAGDVMNATAVTPSDAPARLQGTREAIPV